MMAEKYQLWKAQRAQLKAAGFVPPPYCVICQLEIYMPWYVVFGGYEFTICEECEEWLSSLEAEPITIHGGIQCKKCGTFYDDKECSWCQQKDESED